MGENIFDKSLLEGKTKEEIIQEISNLRKNIKKKHRSLKHEIMESEESWEKKLKPIAEPLKKILEEGEKEKQQRITEADDSNTVVRKRKMETGDEEETPVKRYALPPPQGRKRKQVANKSIDLYASDDEEDYDVGSDTPLSKRLTRENDEMDYDDNNDGDGEPEEVEMDEIQVTPQAPPRYEHVFESPAQMTGQELIKTPQGRNLARQYVEVKFTGRIAKDYFLKLLTKTKVVDTTYGVRVDGNTWMIGDKQLDIIDDDIIIDGIRYKGTRGLYELIFMSQPNEFIYDEEDLENYAKIVLYTNLHKANYSALGKVRSNRGYKYKNIIAPIIGRERVQSAASSSSTSQQYRQRNAEGSGIFYPPRAGKNPMTTYSDVLNTWENSNNIGGSGILLTQSQPTLVYWDDPNELADRLRTLVASQQAGNSGNENEINAIIEELLELEPDLANSN